MNKNIILAISGIFILVILGYVYIETKNSDYVQVQFSDQLAEKMAKNLTEEFCNSLEINQNKSNCAFCKYESFAKVENFGENNTPWIVEYEYGESVGSIERSVRVSVNVPVIYGSNTRNSHLEIFADYNLKTGIINKNFAKNTCL